MTKVLVIGLDGAPYELIRQLSSQRYMPNLSKLIRQGVFGPLWSVFPPISPVAWASLSTGLLPKNHGVLDFFIRTRDYQFRLATLSSRIRRRTIWNMLSRYKKKVCVLHMPGTYPAEEVNGCMVTLPDLPRGVYPRWLLDTLKEEIPNYRTETRVPYSPGNEEEFLKDILLVTRKRAEEAVYLLNNFEWDFFFTVFFHGDTLQHYFWKFFDKNHPEYNEEEGKKYGNAILEYYKLVDSAIGEILSCVDLKNTVIFIVSDHGAGPVFRAFYPNEWLRSLGLLKLKREPFSRRIVKKIVINRLQSSHILLRLINHLPFSLVKVTSKIYTSRLASFTLLPNIDWKRTKAWALGGGGYCSFYINLKRREQKGIVEEEDYEALRENVIKALLDLEDPQTGEKIVIKAFKGEELYFGPFIKWAPDIVCELNPIYEALNECNSNSKFTGPFKRVSAHHKIDGVFVAYGSDIKKGTMINNARVIDLMPTILHIMDVPIPVDTDGDVLTRIFVPTSEFVKKPIRYLRMEKRVEIVRQKLRILRNNCTEEIKF